LNRKITYRPQHRCLEMENATSINQAYAAVVTNDFNYDAWGLSIETLFNPTYSSTFGSFNSPNAQRHRYNGKEQISSSRFYDYGARQYDPVIGRWLSVDPLAEEREWLTPYNMASNNPINRIDPDGALDEPLYKKAWDFVSSMFSGSDATRNTQSIAATTSYTLMKSQQVRVEYKTRVSSLDKTDSHGRTQAKMEARSKTPAVMREVAEQMRPSSGESTRVGGTASKTNAGVNNMIGTLGKVGKVAGVTAIGVSVYNVAKAENKPQAIATEGGALVGAIAGGEIGAQTGAAIGVWFAGAGAVPGAIIGGIIGGIGGGIIGANAGTSTYNAFTTKKEDKK
jgi:RHS repeat-associated protein